MILILFLVHSPTPHPLGRHPDVVKRIAQVMKTAVTPNDRYPIGQIYKGGPVWKPSQP